jgi:alkylation response protein AidB-like acyl-CoA dehydrogenase
MVFTSEQELLRESVRRTCERHCPMATVRTLENDRLGYNRELWSALGELGVAGVIIPEAFGGSGMSLLDAAVVYEEFGRSLVPTPHFVSCVLAAGVINRGADEAMQSGWLPRIAAGEAIATVAWLEPDRGFGPQGVQLEARPTEDGYELTGVKRHVPYAAAAAVMLVLARTPDGVAIFTVAPDAAGVTLTQDLTVAGDTQFSVDFDAVTVGGDQVVLDASGAWPAWHDTMLDGVILLAAQASGGARAALDLAVDYAKTRQQFDKPLGAFQALAHYLADGVTRVDGAQALAWEAAWSRDAGRSVARLAPMAKAYACRTFREVTATAEQIFGGVGFTVDFDIQLYFRRAKALQLNYWDDRHLDALIAAQLLDAG